MDQLPRYARRFLETLVNDVGLIVVLRGHLYVEAAIDKLVLQKVPGSEVFLKGLNFQRKVAIAVRLGALSDECKKPIEVLSRIRNEFAHKVDRDELTEADDQRMKAALSVRLAVKASECISGDLDGIIGGWARAGIAAIHNELQHELLRQMSEVRQAESRMRSPTET